MVATNKAVPIIHLESITRVFKNGEIETPVLHGIDVDIYPGEFVAIVGQSGSGKSTLMNILGCLDKPTSGRYEFNGRDVASLNRDGLAQLRREEFGFVFQSYNLLAGLSARDNVAMPAIYAGVPVTERNLRAEQLLASLGLAERFDHRPNQLSGGQQQRVSIARALMNGGNIILADEPTGALDSKSGKDVMALLKDLSAKGHTVILITHDASIAANADRVIEIRDGLIVQDPGPKAKEKETLKLKPTTAIHTSLFSELAEATKTGLRSLRSNIFRTILTLLGIVIGVGSVISMLAIGDGAKQQVVDRISAMGSNLLLIRPGAPNSRGGRWGASTLVNDDVEALNQLDHILAAIPELTGGQTLRYENNDHSAEVNATSYRFPIARQWPISQGTFFNEEDEASYSTVAVLGKTVAEKFFPEGDSIGQYIMVNNLLFQVIGVMSERGASPMGQDQDDIVFVPFSTGSLRIFGQRFLRSATIAVDDQTKMTEVQQAAHAMLLDRHGTEDFQIFNMASLIDTVSETQNTMTWLLGSIAAISLLVGGIGVMNIMLVSVTERTREIGIRMATGARTRHILQQFLIEAVTVSAIGGVIGVVAGLTCAALLAYLGTPIFYSLTPVVLAFSCAFITGLVFGYLPARKAARLDPVTALATE